MEEADYKAASDEFLDSKWARQVGSRAVELTEMIRTGEYL
jgi:lysozyme